MCCDVVGINCSCFVVEGWGWICFDYLGSVDQCIISFYVLSSYPDLVIWVDQIWACLKMGYIYIIISYIYKLYIYSLISQKNISIGRMMINHWILGYTVFRQTHFICPVLSRSIRIQKTCPLCPLFLGHHFASQSSSERKLWLRALSNLKARCWWTWVGCGDSNRNDLNLR